MIVTRETDTIELQAGDSSACVYTERKGNPPVDAFTEFASRGSEKKYELVPEVKYSGEKVGQLHVRSRSDKEVLTVIVQSNTLRICDNAADSESLTRVAPDDHHLFQGIALFT